MKSTKLLFLMLAAVMAVFASSCNSDSDSTGSGPVIPSNTLYDFATLSSTTKSGSVFTVIKANDSQPITYTSTESLSENSKVKTGDRLVIAYTTTNGLQAYQSGPINLIGYISMSNADQNVGEFNGIFSSDPVEMEVLTRTGNYINMQMQLYARNNLTSGKISLVADPAKLNIAVPELYLVYENPTNMGDNQYLAYASFDISDIWSRSTCKGVKVTYQTPGGMKSVTFNNNDVITPTPAE